MTVRTVCCIGSCDIGIFTCFVIASKCPEIRVIILDKPETISEWNSDAFPVSDPDIADIVKKCRNRNLFFNSDYPTAIRASELIFVSIKANIKTGEKGEGKTLDLKQVEDAARKITTYAETSKVIVEKSRTPAQVAERISQVVQSTCEPGIRIDVLSNPEFLKEGSLLEGLLSPEMVVIGCAKTPNGKAAAQVLSSVYERWIPQNNIIFINMMAAEEIKLAGTALLLRQEATLMALGRLSKETTVDEKIFRRFVGIDAKRKIYGDIRHLMSICEYLKVPEIADYWESVKYRHKVMEETFMDKFRPVQDKNITILGISKSGSVKDSDPTPVDMCKWLLSERATVNVCDPKGQRKQVVRYLNLENIDENETSLTVHEDVYRAVEGSSIVVFYGSPSDYSEFSYFKIFRLMSEPKMFVSGLNLSLDEEDQIKKIGFQFIKLGDDDI